MAVNIQDTMNAKQVDPRNTFLICARFRINKIDDPPPKINPTGQPMSIPKVAFSYKPHRIMSISILKMPPPIAPMIAQAQITASVFALFCFWIFFSGMIFSCNSLCVTGAGADLHVIHLKIQARARP